MKRTMISLLLCSSFSASAALVYNEPPVDVPAVHQIGSGVQKIYGHLGPGDPSDTFRFFWDGGQIVLNTFWSTFDTQLTLTNNLGQPFGYNDDFDQYFYQSEIVRHLNAGTYLLKITSADPLTSVMDYEINRNVSTNGIISGIGPTPHIGLQPPNPPIPQIPEPSILSLLGIGLLGLTLYGRKKTN